MRCPNCGAKFPKNANICIHCGTEMSQLETASNQAVIKARKEYQPELVVYSSIFPSDLSYKKTLLLCIFLGFFGAHRYYTKQKLSAILMTIASIALCIVSAILGMQWGGYLDITSLGITIAVFNNIINIVALIGAISIVVWAFDLLFLILKKYKVPVVLGKKEQKGK